MGEATNSSDAGGACHDLDAADVERVTAFMAAVTRAFELADPDLLEALSHEGGDPRGRRNSYEFNRSLMEGGDKVRSWSARPYTEPKWSIMRTLRHHPPPSIWIDVTLNDGVRDYPYCFACATDADGVLRSCYYVDRERRRKSRPK
jgi:hypothetical protein